MARTKQTARMSTGGMKPRSRVPPGDVGRETVADTRVPGTAEQQPAEPPNLERRYEVSTVLFIPTLCLWYIVSCLQDLLSVVQQLKRDVEEIREACETLTEAVFEGGERPNKKIRKE